MTDAIVMENVVKRFGPTTALDRTNLQVRTGEVHGFLGPNGAGKSTTIRVLLGLLRHDSGTVRLLDADPWKDTVGLHRRLAYVPGDVQLWPNLTGGEIIDVFGRLRGGFSEARKNDMCERFALDPRKKARTYSKGNRQKVALVSALVSDVELFLFDEPTSGLDPLMEAEFQEVVRELTGEGRTVLLSSHILAQVESLADRLSIIRDGQTVESGSLADLRHLSRTAITVTTQHSTVGLSQLPSVHNWTEAEGRSQFEIDGPELDTVLRALTPLGVLSLVAHPPTLEQLLLRHYSDRVSPETRTATLGNL